MLIYYRHLLIDLIGEIIIMWDQNTQISDVQEQVLKQQDLMAEASSKNQVNLDRFQQALANADVNLDLDLENAQLADVNKQNVELQNYIAAMIAALDETTIGIGQDFTAMRQKTSMEKLVGIFSNKKSEEINSDFLVLGESDLKEAKGLESTVKIDCEKCHNQEGVWWTFQTRSADEPETKFYRCTKCNHTWRDYT